VKLLLLMKEEIDVQGSHNSGRNHALLQTRLERRAAIGAVMYAKLLVTANEDFSLAVYRLWNSVQIRQMMGHPVGDGGLRWQHFGSVRLVRQLSKTAEAAFEVHRGRAIRQDGQE
jgi:hypothetical protein